MDFLSAHTVRSAIGPRDSMQDNVLAQSSPPFLVIADGVGSYEESDQAALLAVDTFASWAQNPGPDIAEGLLALPDRVAARIRQARIGFAATTLAGAILHESGSLWLTNVGDSVIAALTADTVLFVSREHQIAAYTRMIGSPDPVNLARGNVLTRAVSAGDRIRTPDVSVIRIHEPTIVVAATDGITGRVTLEQIHEDIFTDGPPPAELEHLETWLNTKADHIMAHAVAKTLFDNATLGLLAIVPTGLDLPRHQLKEHDL
uniref:PP2C family protein-serine/threonine phosphatase n=1 Tax=Rhodococcus qingshengii TaxID=334542 RepID=UPI001C4E04B1|nr:protein phosphatase 2C domain-containing protein [Rhodococcus qingshengii]